MAGRPDATRNQFTLEVAHVGLVIIRISVSSPCASFEKRRSGSIRDVLSGVEADRAVDLTVTCDAWLFNRSMLQPETAVPSEEHVMGTE